VPCGEGVGAHTRRVRGYGEDYMYRHLLVEKEYVVGAAYIQPSLILQPGQSDVVMLLRPTADVMHPEARWVGPVYHTQRLSTTDMRPPPASVRPVPLVVVGPLFFSCKSLAPKCPKDFTCAQATQHLYRHGVYTGLHLSMSGRGMGVPLAAANPSGQACVSV
jgi:hypothetical protein